MTEAAVDRWRLFVALPIGDRLRGSLAAAVSEWRAAADAPPLRWLAPEGWHLTLAFIGWTDAGRAKDLVARLAAVAAGHRTFTVRTGGIGAFPNLRRARVLWYGVEDARAMEVLATAVHQAIGAEGGDRFHAHVTLARARVTHGVDLSEWAAARVNVPRGSIAAEHLVLYRSHLGRGPARYEALARMPLDGAAQAEVVRG